MCGQALSPYVWAYPESIVSLTALMEPPMIDQALSVRWCRWLSDYHLWGLINPNVLSIMAIWLRGLCASTFPSFLLGMQGRAFMFQAVEFDHHATSPTSIL